MQDFLNLMFCFNIVPLTNKLTRVNRHSANAKDHIITTLSITGHNDFKSAAIKTDLSDHFPLSSQLKPLKKPKGQS